ncbi:Scr1 family TA system antitoxin-like transcriptional regulator [Streptomyces shenzhenensis]|uniref:Scr1 family TA system antitoxin-like transcriptional regulator n=1 Tax=Streptomyces shenzhenensis TaxID=943815 RepID=UPI0027E4872F|nr:Scr1 family TA system antitoxin-like transcriptional regulator [Streptomyces shenzhenensis]
MCERRLWPEVSRAREPEQRIEARIGRQKMLDDEDAPPSRGILFEAVLRNALGDLQAWRAQLEHLLEASERPDITLHVPPRSAAGPTAW